MLVVGVQLDTSVTVGLAATYNGAAMTLAVSQIGINQFSGIFYLANPSSGANNIVISITANSWITSGGISLTGTGAGIGATAANAITTGSPSKSISTTVANSWLVDSLYQNNGGLSMTVGGSQTQRYDTTTSADGFRGYGSTQVCTTVTSYTMSWTQGSGAADSTTQVIVEITPPVVAVAARTLPLTLLGVG